MQSMSNHLPPTPSTLHTHVTGDTGPLDPEEGGLVLRTQDVTRLQGRPPYHLARDRVQ